MRCRDCPARDYPSAPFEPARNGSPLLAIVGEAPGRHEIDEKRPFIGASGKMLMRGLRHECGLDRGAIHWTNSTFCRPPDYLQQRCVQVCSSRLRAELAAVHPRIIMPVGAWGLSSLLHQGKRKVQIQKWRGSVSHIDLSSQPEARAARPVRTKRKERAGSIPAGRTERADVAAVASVETAASLLEPHSAAVSALLMPTLHPAFVMKGRNPLMAPLLELDVERIGRYLYAPFVAPEDQPGRTLTVPSTEDELAHHLRSLGDELGNDVETVGLGPTRTALVCLGLSDGTRTVVIPWSQGRDGKISFWLKPKRIAKLLSEVLSSRLSITHNGPYFDFIVEDRYGIVVRRWDDTLLMSHALRAHEPKNLFHVVSRGLDVPPWKMQEDRTATIERLYTYNGRDVLYTRLRWAQLHEELAQCS